MEMSMKKLLIAAAVTAALAACTTTSPDVIQKGDAQRMSQVQDATVLSVRPVVVEGNQSGIGAAAGGVVGGVAGSTVGGHRENAVVGVLGRSEEHTSELQSHSDLVCRLLLEKKKEKQQRDIKR